MGELFGNYEVLRRIAAGGMAEVLLAKHKGIGGFERLVCLKRILPHLSAQEEFIKMFQDEARIAANLVHPNVAQIYDISAVDNTYYIAMEYVRGEDLRRVYNQEVGHGQAMPLHIAALIIMGAAAGLNYAHRQVDLNGNPLNIVHRDISPQNILITYDGHVKVIDFGVAKAVGKLNQTRAGVLKGKYSYMSPEQASGDPIDGRTDVFALGTTLYEVTTGVRLFKRDNELETLHAVIACNVKPPSEVVRGYDAALEAIILRALAYDPEARYTTAGEMEHDLERYLLSRGHPTSASSLAGYMQDLFAEKLADEALFGGHPWQEGGTPNRAPPVRPIGDSTARTGPDANNEALAQPAQARVADDAEPTTVDEQPTVASNPRAPEKKAATASIVEPPTANGTPSDWALGEPAESTQGGGPRPDQAAAAQEARPTPRLAPPEGFEAPRAGLKKSRLKKSRRFSVPAIAALMVLIVIGVTLERRRQTKQKEASERAARQEVAAAEASQPQADDPAERKGAATEAPADIAPHAAETEKRVAASEGKPTEPIANLSGRALVDVLAPEPMAVTLGNNYLGDTPLFGLRLPAGTLRLRLEDRDSGLIVRRSVVARNEQRTRVEVKDARGEVSVTSAPWAWVQFGQRPARETPQSLHLIEGEYTFVMECPDGRRRQEVVHVVAGAKVHIDVPCGNMQQ